MLSNFVWIIQNNCIDSNFWFVFEHTVTLLLLRKLSFHSSLLYYLLPLMHTPNCPYKCHLYLGSINIKTFVFNHVKNGQRGRNTWFRFFKTHIKHKFVCSNSMEAHPPMRYKLIVQRQKRHILSYHVPKRPTVFKKIYFWHLKVQVWKRTLNKNLIFGDFLRQTAHRETNPQNNGQILLQILNPVSDMNILAPELVGDQSEEVFQQFVHTLFLLIWWYPRSWEIN